MSPTTAQYASAMRPGSRREREGHREQAELDALHRNAAAYDDTPITAAR
ncbi:hypothetical protein [Streptomyces sp. LS1784]|nr:hypothetical protein [Streptomyces sp. LS1784]